MWQADVVFCILTIVSKNVLSLEYYGVGKLVVSEEVPLLSVQRSVRTVGTVHQVWWNTCTHAHTYGVLLHKHACIHTHSDTQKCTCMHKHILSCAQMLPIQMGLMVMQSGFWLTHASNVWVIHIVTHFVVLYNATHHFVVCNVAIMTMSPSDVTTWNVFLFTALISLISRWALGK